MSERWLIVADDLTGAADCAIAFAKRGKAATVGWGDRGDAGAAGMVFSYDADSRGLPETAAKDCLARVAYKMPFKCRFVTRRPSV